MSPSPTIDLQSATRRVTYVGMVRSWASWAKIARFRLAGLAAAGWQVGIQELREDRFDPAFPLDRATEAMIAEPVAGNVILTFISPLEYSTLPATAPRVGQLDYEGSRWPVEWIAGAQAHVDRVTVPSTFNRETLIASGLAADKVDVVPYGFDRRAFHASDRRPPGSGNDLRLLFVGTPARRKGLDVLLAGIERAFSSREPVALRIHIVDYPDAASRPYLDQHWRGRVERLRSQDRRIEISTTMMLDDGMADLYRSADLMCHTFRAESFCIPLVEAMACGTPILATAWGGPRDFLDSTVGYPIDDYTLIPGGDMLLDNSGDACVAEPSVAAVAESLRSAFDDREQLAERGATAARRADAFSWQASSRTLSDVLMSTMLAASREAARPVA